MILLGIKLFIRELSGVITMDNLQLSFITVINPYYLNSLRRSCLSHNMHFDPNLTVASNTSKYLVEAKYLKSFMFRTVGIGSANRQNLRSYMINIPMCVGVLPSIVANVTFAPFCSRRVTPSRLPVKSMYIDLNQMI